MVGEGRVYERRERRRPASESVVGDVWPFVKMSKANANESEKIDVRIERM